MYQMAKNKFNQILQFITGFLVLLLGVYTLLNADITISLVTIVISGGILIQGISQLFFYLAYKKHLPNSGFTLFEAILNLIFGIFLIANFGVSAPNLCILVGIWFMFSSVMRIALSLELKDANHDNWWITLVFGTLSTVFSVWLIWNSLSGALDIAITVSISLICSAFLVVGEAFSTM